MGAQGQGAGAANDGGDVPRDLGISESLPNLTPFSLQPKHLLPSATRHGTMKIRHEIPVTTPQFGCNSLMHSQMRKIMSKRGAWFVSNSVYFCLLLPPLISCLFSSQGGREPATQAVSVSGSVSTTQSIPIPTPISTVAERQKGLSTTREVLPLQSKGLDGPRGSRAAGHVEDPG